MNPPKTDSEYQREAERMANECSHTIQFAHCKNADEVRKLILLQIPLASMLCALDERSTLSKPEASDVIRLGSLKQELAVIKESRAVVVDQEQISRIEANRLRAENDALKAELRKTVSRMEAYADTMVAEKEREFGLKLKELTPLQEKYTQLDAELASLKAVAKAGLRCCHYNFPVADRLELHNALFDHSAKGYKLE